MISYRLGATCMQPNWANHLLFTCGLLRRLKSLPDGYHKVMVAATIWLQAQLRDHRQEGF